MTATATPVGQADTNAVLAELQRTGQPFTARVEKARALLKSAQDQLVAIKRRRDFDISGELAGRKFGCEHDANVAHEQAFAKHRAPLIAEQNRQMSAIENELHELHQAREREVTAIRARVVLGASVAAVEIPVYVWRTAEFLALERQRDDAAGEQAQLEGSLVDLVQAATAAKVIVRSVAVAVRLGEQKQTAVTAAERAAADAEKAVETARERLQVLADVSARLDAKCSELQARLESEWQATMMTELRSSTAAIVGHLRAAMAEHGSRFMPLHVALFNDWQRFDSSHPTPLGAIDATDEYAVCRLWIESVQRLGWIDDAKRA